MLTALRSVMEVNSWNHENQSENHSSSRGKAQLPQLLTTAPILSSFSPFSPHYVQSSLHFSADKHFQKRSANRPLSNSPGMLRVPALVTGSQPGLETVKLVQNIFWNITVKSKFLGFTLDKYHFATQCKQICHIQHHTVHACYAQFNTRKRRAEELAAWNLLMHTRLQAHSLFPEDHLQPQLQSLQ